MHITDLYEDKIAVSPEVQKEMKRLRSHAKLELSVCPLYNAEQILLKICYLNTRSLHRHIEDVSKDLNYSTADINIFSETRFSLSDHDSIYAIQNYFLFRNDVTMTAINIRPYGGMAVYSHIEYYSGYPYSCNSNGIEITVVRLITVPHIHIFGIYRSPRVPVTQMCHALSELLMSQSSQFNVFMGDFNVNLLNNRDKMCLYNLFTRDHGYEELVSCYTTDNRTCLDHIYTNIPLSDIKIQILETYFSDHKSVCVLIPPFNLTT